MTLRRYRLVAAAARVLKWAAILAVLIPLSYVMAYALVMLLAMIAMALYG